MESLILSSLSISANCAEESFVAESYSCAPQLTVAEGANPTQLTWELTEDHTCDWMQVNASTGQLFGIPGRSHLGYCVASVRVVADIDSPRAYSMAVNVLGPKIELVPNNCATTVAVDQSYLCRFDATTLLSDATFTWSPGADNKCAWIHVDSATGKVSGTPPLSAVGSCHLSLSVSVEGMSSRSFSTTLTIPQVPVNVSTGSCPASLEAGTSYSCNPTASAPLAGASFTWSFSPANTCSWAHINTSTGQITGTPPIHSTGNCRLDVTAKIANGSSGQSSSTLKVTTKGFHELFLAESAGDSYEKVGSAVAIDGNWAVIGSPDDFNGAGSASIFQFDGTTWRKRATFNSPAPESIKAFGYSVAISGNSILIGAPYSTSRFHREGAVVAYEFNGASWVQSQIIIPNLSTSQMLMTFGAALDIDGSKAIVATSHYNGEAAYILQKTGSTWSVSFALPFDAIMSSNGPGRVKVALNAGLAVVSDTKGGPTYAGEVRVYRENGGAWSLSGVLSGPSGSKFGTSVDTYNGRILIGAPSDRNTGSVYLYESTADSWVITKTFRAADESSGLQFGQSVSISSTHVAIGAPSAAIFGSTYVYKLSGADWAFYSKLMPTMGQIKDSFGGAVSASGANIFVGASQYSYNSVPLSGGAYIYRAK